MKKPSGPFTLVLILSAAVLAQTPALFAQSPTGTKSPAGTPTPQWRPAYHFTPEKNWTNDPNGLLYLNGVYHLYNQQNPFENKWGHMSWGHASSTDLIHWRHLPLALPETIDKKDTTWRFSGCAVWDKDNTSSFCKKGGCMVIIYTADQPHLKKESQYIAYSNDGGTTFTNYAHNPVIDLYKKDFRDPNVTWNEELKKWLMVVVLPYEYKAQFYSSPDLKKWELLSEFGPAGYTGAPWECPSLIQLPVDDNTSPAKGTPPTKGAARKKWVLMISAAGGKKGVFMQYFTGNFTKGKFVNDNPAGTVLTVDYGDCNYAAIPWNNVPGDKKILIGWMMPGKTETSPWKGQMTIPRDLSLRNTAEGYRLLATPSSIIRNHLSALAAKPAVDRRQWHIDNKEIDLRQESIHWNNSYWITTELTPGPGATTGFRIAQKAEISYDGAHHQLHIKNGHSEPTTIDLPPTLPTDREHPIPTSAPIRMEILVDKSSLEIFINNGEKVHTTYIYPDKGATGLSIFSTGGATMVNSLIIHNFSKIRQ